jgi:ATP-binding cassette, subfamily B, bacterial PglK
VGTLLELWSLLDRRQRRAFVWLQALSVLMAFTTLGGVAALVPFLLALTDQHSIAQQPLLGAVYRELGLEDPHSFTLLLGAAFVVAVLLANLVTLLGAAAMKRFALAVGDDFNSALLDEYLWRDLRSRTVSGAGKLFNRVIHSVDRVTNGLIESCLVLISSALGVLVICATIVWLNPLIVLAALLWIGAAYLLTYIAARRRLGRNGALERELIERRARMARESLRAAKELQTSGLQAGFVERFAQASRALSRIAMINHLIAQSPRYVLECVTFAGLVGIALFFSNGRTAGSWLAQLSFLALAAYRLLPAVQQLFASAVRIRASRASFEDILPDLRAALSRRRSASAGSNDEFLHCPRFEIRLEGVSVSFEPQQPAVDDVSMVIPAGAMIGLVGPNASGKTTLVDIIAGLLPPDRGRLLVDGKCVDGGNRADWRRQAAYVAQEVYLLDASIAENIAFGVAARDIDRERVAEAARLAGLDEVLARSPLGLDTPVAEDGLCLSGGYRQRVAIARAFYRRAAILILDEATSALDSAAEQELIEALQRMRGESTLVVIAHRPRILRNCDRIYELEQGRIVAQGSFDEILGAAVRSVGS